VSSAKKIPGGATSLKLKCFWVSEDHSTKRIRYSIYRRQEEGFYKRNGCGGGGRTGQDSMDGSRVHKGGRKNQKRQNYAGGLCIRRAEPGEKGSSSSFWGMKVVFKEKPNPKDGVKKG